MKARRRLSIGQRVQLSSVSRRGFYRFRARTEAGPDRDMDLRDAIQRIALEWPSYGRIRITVHHSDRGVQYASTDYTDLLKTNDIAISMSRKGNPYDNARCESFMKTLKSEEVYRNEYRDLADARSDR